jgi:hypothetical protein
MKTKFCNIFLALHYVLQNSLIENLLKAETHSNVVEKSKLCYQQRAVLDWINAIFNLIQDLQPDCLLQQRYRLLSNIRRYPICAVGKSVVKRNSRSNCLT